MADGRCVTINKLVSFISVVRFVGSALYHQCIRFEYVTCGKIEVFNSFTCV